MRGLDLPDDVLEALADQIDAVHTPLEADHLVGTITDEDVTARP